MSNYRFNEAERWAVYSTYDRICYMCRKPIDLQTMEVDHILPEHLQKDPKKLSGILAQYGLPMEFDLNDYGNWLPACGSCNSTKLGSVFEPTPIIQIQIANSRSKADKAKAAENEVVTDRSLARAIGVVIRADQASQIGDEHIGKLITHLFAHDDDLRKLALNSLQSRRQPDNTLGFVVAPLKLDFTPFYSVLFEDGRTRIVRTPYGVGYQPIGEQLHSSFRCGNCGSLGPWAGARCLTCGYLSDD